MWIDVQWAVAVRDNNVIGRRIVDLRTACAQFYKAIRTSGLGCAWAKANHCKESIPPAPPPVLLQVLNAVRLHQRVSEYASRLNKICADVLVHTMVAVFALPLISTLQV